MMNINRALGRLYPRAFSKKIQRTELGYNKPSARNVKKFKQRTALFPGVAADLESLRSQIIMERGGRLLCELQKVALEAQGHLAHPSVLEHPAQFLQMAKNNLSGGRRRDLPVTPAEVKDVLFCAISLTLDFDDDPSTYLRQLLSHYSESTGFLAPYSKEQAVVGAEAYQQVGDFRKAQVVISDAFGRFGEDGDREMMCLQANNAYLAH